MRKNYILYDEWHEAGRKLRIIIFSDVIHGKVVELEGNFLLLSLIYDTRCVIVDDPQ